MYARHTHAYKNVQNHINMSICVYIYVYAHMYILCLCVHMHTYIYIQIQLQSESQFQALRRSKAAVDASSSMHGPLETVEKLRGARAPAAQAVAVWRTPPSGALDQRPYGQKDLWFWALGFWDLRFWDLRFWVRPNMSRGQNC